VTVSSPLQYDHAVPAAGLSTYVADVTRNVVLQSENPSDVSGRGHVMFMTSQVNIAYVGFYGLGRTNKLVPVNDPQLDQNGNLIPGTGTNPRGRYPVHFHHTGVDASVPPAVVSGSAVVDSPGWGFVNHDSYVNFVNDVAYNTTGAGFVAESGDEIGAFRGDLAVRSVGSGEDIDSRISLQDFGHEGVGFWLQGNGVAVESDIAIEQAHAGFVMYSNGLIDPEMGPTRFLAANLPDPDLAQGQTYVDVGAVPFRSFLNNQAYASADGLNIRYNQPFLGTHSVVSGLIAWNAHYGAEILYTSRLIVQNSWFVSGNAQKYGWVGIFEGNEGVDDTTYSNNRVEGWYTGLHVSEQGRHYIDGGFYNNICSIQIPTAFSANRNVTIAGSIQFGTMGSAARGGVPQYDVYLLANLKAVYSRGFEQVFAPGQILYQGLQLYFLEQAAGFIPIPSQVSAPPIVPSALIGKTNGQLWQAYGLAMAGALAPAATSIVGLRLRGIAGALATYPDSYTLMSAQFTSQLDGYQLAYRRTDASKASPVTVDPTPATLQEGWNLITRLIDGYLQTFFVFGDVTPPTFRVDPNLVLAVQASELSNSFTVVGTIVDNADVTGVKQSFSQPFTGLDRLPLHQRSDGSTYLILSFTIADLAGNTSQVDLEITVLPS
jgi:hypothetical protein